MTTGRAFYLLLSEMGYVNRGGKIWVRNLIVKYISATPETISHKVRIDFDQVDKIILIHKSLIVTLKVYGQVHVPESPESTVTILTEPHEMVSYQLTK